MSIYQTSPVECLSWCSTKSHSKLRDIMQHWVQIKSFHVRSLRNPFALSFILLIFLNRFSESVTPIWTSFRIWWGRRRQHSAGQPMGSVYSSGIQSMKYWNRESRKTRYKPDIIHILDHLRWPFCRSMSRNSVSKSQESIFSVLTRIVNWTVYIDVQPTLQFLGGATKLLIVPLQIDL